MIVSSSLPASILATSLSIAVDQPQEMLAAAADRADVFTLIGGWVTVAQEAGRCQDDAEGRAELVAHVSQERALGPVGGLRLIARLDKFVSALFNQRPVAAAGVPAIP